LCGQPTGKTSAFVTGGHYVFAGNRTDCSGEAHGAAKRPFSERFRIKIRLSL
jgi:hypothetical protein